MIRNIGLGLAGAGALAQQMLFDGMSLHMIPFVPPPYIMCRVGAPDSVAHVVQLTAVSGW